MLRTIVVTSLAAASVVNGATSVCDSAVTINSAADLTQLSSCTTLGSDLNINAATSDLSTVQLQIQSIKGNLNVGGVMIANLEMPLLNSIGGIFNMSSLTALASVTMGSLTSVGGINWDTLGPQFSQLAFTQGIGSAGGVNITNTFLQSLDGINVQNTADFDITNNKFLKIYNSQLKTVSNTLSLAANGANFSATFPNLVWAKIVKFRDLTTLTLPSLVRVNGSLEVDENQFASFSTPKLTNVDQSLAFVANPLLTNISMPLLTRTGGGFTVANNTDLTDFDGAPKLTQVIGSLDFSGNFENASFPSISDVEGVFNFQTTQSFDCSTFNSYANNQVKGPVKCEGKVSDPTTATGTSSAGTASSTAKSAGVSTYATGSFGAIIMAAIMGAIVL